MAEVAPFRGLRFNRAKVPALADVVIPPYDVISPSEQDFFLRLNPFNIIRLELGKSQPGDSATDNPHTRAAETLDIWRREGVLVRDAEPSLYYYEVDYATEGGAVRTRNGFLCRLKLEEFASGGVRPHEKTFQAVKDERLGLMTTTRTNLSPVFALYSDPEAVVEGALRSARGTEPDMAFEDRQGLRHRVWPVSDAGAVEAVREAMRGKALFIADGHHRYETALNYRNLQRRAFPEAGPDAPFEYVMVYLCNLNQKGLSIFPTHRLLANLTAFDEEAFLGRCGEFFRVKRFDSGADGEAAWRAALDEGFERKKRALGFCSARAEHLVLLEGRDDALDRFLSADGIPEELRGLDVVVLDHIVLRHLMGLPEDFLVSGNHLQFKHDFGLTLEGVRSGAFDAAFLINPTRIEQVQDVANAGLIMPHKSTYFYPKAGSGLVLNLLSPGEEAS